MKNVSQFAFKAYKKDAEDDIDILEDPEMTDESEDEQYSGDEAAEDTGHEKEKKRT